MILTTMKMVEYTTGFFQNDWGGNPWGEGDDDKKSTKLNLVLVSFIYFIYVYSSSHSPNITRLFLASLAHQLHIPHKLQNPG